MGGVAVNMEAANVADEIRARKVFVSKFQLLIKVHVHLFLGADLLIKKKTMNVKYEDFFTRVSLF